MYILIISLTVVFVIALAIAGFCLWKLKRIRDGLIINRDEITSGIEHCEEYHRTETSKLDSYPPKIRAEFLASLNQYHNKIAEMYKNRDNCDELIAKIDRIVN